MNNLKIATERNAGASLEWAKNAGIMKNENYAAAEIEALSVPNSGSAIFIPGLCGLGHPHNDDTARGALMGIHRGTSRAHVLRAIFEGVGFRYKKKKKILVNFFIYFN